MGGLTDIYRVAIEREIRDRRTTERWYRANRWAEWPDLRRENLVILRALVRLARAARRQARAEGIDPITQAKGMTESERAFAWGR